MVRRLAMQTKLASILELAGPAFSDGGVTIKSMVRLVNQTWSATDERQSGAVPPFRSGGILPTAQLQR